MYAFSAALALLAAVHASTLTLQDTDPVNGHSTYSNSPLGVTSDGALSGTASGSADAELSSDGTLTINGKPVHSNGGELTTADGGDIKFTNEGGKLAFNGDTKFFVTNDGLAAPGQGSGTGVNVLISGGTNANGDSTQSAPAPAEASAGSTGVAAANGAVKNAVGVAAFAAMLL